MESKGSRQWVFVVFAISLYSPIVIGGLHLLLESKLSGAEFIALIVSFAVICTAIGFAPQVQEISVAGNALKLRDVKEEATRVISDLQSARSELLGMMLIMVMKQAGGFHDGKPVDPRVEHFLNCVSMIRKYQCYKEHKEKIKELTNTLLASQFGRVFATAKIQGVGPYKMIRPNHLVHMVVQKSPMDEVEIDGVILNYSEEVESALVAYQVLYSLYHSSEQDQSA